MSVPARTRGILAAAIALLLVAGAILLYRGIDRNAPGEGKAGPSSPIDEIRAVYEGPRYPVLLIGIDAADWAVMGPLMEKGELPALRSLRDRGAWGVLKSLRPMLSPLLWTTVATGRTPDEHGIVDFLVNDPSTGLQVPITSQFRRTRALWSILTDLGQPSLTVGWWATWPAERVLGVMVTERVAYSLFESGGGPVGDGAIYPESMAEPLLSLVVEPQEVSLEEVREIIRIGEAEYSSALESLAQASSWEDPVAHLMRVLASTRSYHRIALDRLRAGQPPLSLIYFEGLDEVNHRFAHYAAPAMRWADPSKIPAFEHAVENFYRLQDRQVGELMAAADPQSVVLVISDHGFGWGDRRPTEVPPDIEGKPGRWHTNEGVILAAGPPVRPGRLPRDPDLLDVAPTILALLSLPRAVDMKGEVIEAIAPPGALPAPPHGTIATYEPAAEEPRADQVATGSPGEEEMLAKLTALGYISSGSASPEAGGDAPSAGAPAGALTVTGHVNAGNLLLVRGDAAGAEREFRAALARGPDYVPARLGLAQALIAGGREEEGWRRIGEALLEGRDLDAGIYLKVARFYHQQGRMSEGADLFESLPRREGLEAARLAAAGILRSAAGEAGAAEHLLRAALREESDFPEALQEMYDLLTRRGALEDLASILEEAVAARPGGGQASNLLALTYERLGRAGEAVKVLEQVLETSPRDVATLANLAGMLLRREENRAALDLLERAREVDLSNAVVLVNLIVARGKVRDVEGAREAFESAGGLEGRVEFLNAMAFVYYVNDRPDEARSLLERSLDREPGQKEARRLLDSIEREAAGGDASPSGTGPGL